MLALYPLTAYWTADQTSASGYSLQAAQTHKNTGFVAQTKLKIGIKNAQLQMLPNWTQTCKSKQEATKLSQTEYQQKKKQEKKHAGNKAHDEERACMRPPQKQHHSTNKSATAVNLRIERPMHQFLIFQPYSCDMPVETKHKHHTDHTDREYSACLGQHTIQ